jgi:uncharacterized membrane protein YccF (DUF307 family)
MAQPSQVNVQVNIGPAQVRKQPGCLVQLLFFLFIGWWLGGISVGLAYVLFIFIITIPLGVKIINKVPYLMALREPEISVTPWGQVPVKQRNILLRIVWFFLIGFWFTGIWMALAYLLCCTILGMPIGFWMFDRSPALLTLRRS